MKNTEAVAVRETQAVSTFVLSAQDIQTLVAVGAIPDGTPPDVITFFGRSCAESRLSPFKRQIHLIKRNSKTGVKYTIQTGIDGYRAVANRTGVYAGNDEYLFDEGLKEFQMIQAKRQGPTTATSTVYKLVGGQRCPFAATARWEEYCPEGNAAFMWNKMPFLMLGKTAEALALRKAFPEELSGIYTDEEMQQADAPAAPQRAASLAPAQRPPDAPKAPPTPTAATPSPAKSVNVKACRARFLAVIAKNRDFAWLLAVNKGWILDTEPLENMTDSYIPTTKDAFEAFTLELDGLMTDFDGKFPADKQAQYDAAYDDVPMDDPPVDVEKLKLATDDSWRAFVVPFGKNAGKTLGSLPKNTCFGFYANFKVELEYKGRARKPEALDKDKAFREALDQAGQFYEFTKPEGEVTP